MANADIDVVGSASCPRILGRFSGQRNSVDVGAAHTCALLEGGSVRCWGRGESGRLGYANGDNVGDDEVPASVGGVAIF